MKMIFFLNKEEKHKIENHVAHNNQMVNYYCWVIFWKFNKRDNEEIALNCAFNYFFELLRWWYKVFLPIVYSQKITRSFCSQGSHIPYSGNGFWCFQGLCLSVWAIYIFIFQIVSMCYNCIKRLREQITVT